jgi:Flp pilus assembly pilin Flp
MLNPLTALMARLQVLLFTLLGGQRRVAAARGITFIEYAILAAIAVVIGLLFKNQLSALFNTLFGRLTGAINIT